MTLKTHIASREVESAQEAYDQVRLRYEEASSGPLTAEKVVSQISLRMELEEAAKAVEKARATQAEIAAKEAEERKAKAREQLAEVEVRLVADTTEAEKLMDQLAPLLVNINTEGKKRYGLRMDVSGRAEHGLIPTGLIVGWLRHRLAGLESPDLGRAHRHQRGSLADLLALTPATESEEVSR